VCDGFEALLIHSRYH